MKQKGTRIMNGKVKIELLVELIKIVMKEKKEKKGVLNVV